MITIEDLKPYVVKTIDNRRINKILPQDHPIVLELFEKFGDDDSKINWEHIQNHLSFKAPNRKYGLESIAGNGEHKISKYNVIDRYYEGKLVIIEYKGVRFYFDLLKDGTVYRAFHDGRGIYGCGWSNRHRLLPQETLEGYYQEFIDTVKDAKRKAMNYYNKEIKDLKQEYKTVLAEHNRYLKGGSK